MSKSLNCCVLEVFRSYEVPLAALWVLLEGLGDHLRAKRAILSQNDSSWYHLGPRLGPSKMAYVPIFQFFQEFS